MDRSAINAKLTVVLFAWSMAACTVTTTTDVNNGTCEPLAGDGLLPYNSEANQMPVEVGCGYVNEPCVAITICVPGSDAGFGTPGNCQTIDHILLDTGSYGLRLFNCNVTLNLPHQYDGAVTTNGDLTSGSTQLTNVSITTGISTGMTIVGLGIPSGTTVTSLSGSTITMSAAATSTASSESLTVNHEIAECVTYADGTGDWGPVMLGDVSIGQETAYDLPIQIIDPNYSGGAPANPGCGQTEYSPQVSGFNGILGVGLLTTDCAICASLSDQGYYACSNGTCNGAKVATSLQVTNPITLLRIGGPSSSQRDNNGVILSLNAVGNELGAKDIQGTLTFGIDTAAGDNSSSGKTLYEADASANFVSLFEGNRYPASFVDSGSNFWDFPTPSSGADSIPECSDNGLYCPSSLQSLSVQGASSGTSSYGTPVDFSVINADAVVENGNTCFDNVGAPFSGGFDWGLPFFYNREVFVGIENKSSNLGTGPYWAW